MKHVGRNDPCPCGSGKKFKRCCLDGSAQRPAHCRPTYFYAPSDPAAENLPPIESLGDVRHYLDAVAHRHPLLRLPRCEALVHSLRAAQTFDICSIVSAGEARDYHGFYEPMRKLQDSLKYLIFKIHTRCPEGGDGKTPTTQGLLELARDALSCFSAFSDIHDCVVSAEAGFLRWDLGVEARCMRFTFANDEVEAHERGSLLNQHELAGTAHLSAADSRATDTLRAHLMRLVRGAVVSGNGQRLTYSTPDGALGEFVREAERTEGEECQLPEEWAVGPYTVRDHRHVWRLLRAISAMHTAVLLELAVTRRAPPPPIGSELRLDIEQLVAACTSVVGVGPGAARAVLRDLTYDPAVRWTDVMYQPLFAVGSRELLSCRVLIEGNRFERNLLALLPRLPNRRDGEENLKRGREQVMIDELRTVAEEVGLSSRARVKLQSGSQLLSDVDLLLWGHGTLHALAISLKWFYGPDSLQEVRNHDGWYHEAVAAARDAAAFVQSHATALSLQFGLSPALGPAAQVHPVVVSRVGLPSGLVETTGCPVVTQGYFSAVLRESCGDLARVMTRLPAPQPLVTAAEDVRRGHIPVPFGAHLFHLPAVEATWVEPP